MKLVLIILIIIIAVILAGWWLANQLGGTVTVKNSFNMSLSLTSPVLPAGGVIPSLYTCDGNNLSLPLKIDYVPPAAKSLALVVDDPDAPNGSFIHWLVWNLKPTDQDLMEGVTPSPAVAGTNSAGQVGYSGPCPPTGEHRYIFKLLALDTKLDLPVSTTIKEFNQATAGHILEETTLTGRYRRSD